jgi:hypothetical protein
MALAKLVMVVALQRRHQQRNKSKSKATERIKKRHWFSPMPFLLYALELTIHNYQLECNAHAQIVHSIPLDSRAVAIIKPYFTR